MFARLSAGRWHPDPFLRPQPTGPTEHHTAHPLMALLTFPWGVSPFFVFNIHPDCSNRRFAAQGWRCVLKSRGPPTPACGHHEPSIASPAQIRVAVAGLVGGAPLETNGKVPFRIRYAGGIVVRQLPHTFIA
jgi:hypothetical protein